MPNHTADITAQLMPDLERHLPLCGKNHFEVRSIDMLHPCSHAFVLASINKKGDPAGSPSLGSLCLQKAAARTGEPGVDEDREAEPETFYEGTTFGYRDLHLYSPRSGIAVAVAVNSSSSQDELSPLRLSIYRPDTACRR
jgi:hypothetical protein